MVISEFWSFETRKVKDFSWVTTKVNSGHDFKSASNNYNPLMISNHCASLIIITHKISFQIFYTYIGSAETYWTWGLHEE